MRTWYLTEDFDPEKAIEEALSEIYSKEIGNDTVKENPTMGVLSGS